MPKTIIPMRPENLRSQLNQSEQTALTWFVLSGCTRDEAFLTFARPDMAGSAAKSVVKETIKQFFARAEVKEYISAYTETLNNLVNPKKPKKSDQEAVSLEERKAIARTKAMEFAMDLANHIKVEEQPRRYLPVTCSECAYRKFVEENCEEVPDGTELAGEKETE